MKASDKQLLLQAKQKLKENKKANEPGLVKKVWDAYNLKLYNEKKELTEQKFSYNEKEVARKEHLEKTIPVKKAIGKTLWEVSKVVTFGDIHKVNASPMKIKPAGKERRHIAKEVMGKPYKETYRKFKNIWSR